MNVGGERTFAQQQVECDENEISRHDNILDPSVNSNCRLFSGSATYEQHAKHRVKSE